MGEMTFIKNGVVTTIHDNGDVSSAPAERCDGCQELKSGDFGFKVIDISGTVILWLCQECRK
jgi:hypothetical protein